MHHDHGGRTAAERDMDEVSDGIVAGALARHRRDDVGGDAGDHVGIAVGWRVRDRGGTDQPTGAATVLDDDLLR